MRQSMRLLLSALFCMILCCIPSFAADTASLPYTDVDASAPHYDAIACMTERELMNGIAADRFGAEANLTRAQLVTILWRLEGKPVVNYLMQFDDVTQEVWYAEAVRWAAAEGIAEGYDGRFDPLAPITRAELAAMLYRYVQYHGGGFTGMWMFPLRYDDAIDVPEWAYEPMCWLTMKGVYLPQDGRLMPNETITRGESAAILHRLITLE